MFKSAKSKILVAVSIGTAIFVPALCQMVQSQRGNGSMGGEVLLFLIPLIVWLATDTYEKSRRARAKKQSKKPKTVYKIQILGIDSVDVKEVKEV